MRAIPVGLRYMAESALYFSFMSASVKWAGARGVPWQQIVFARSVFAMCATFYLLQRAQISPWGNARGWLAARGLLGVGGLTCFYYSVTHLPLGDATVIQYTNPTFVALFAVFVVGERLRGRDLVAAALCLIGVACIARPSFLFGGESRLATFDVAVALGGALISALAYTTVRRLGRTEHPLVTVLWFPLIATPLTLPLAVAVGHVPDAMDLVPLLLVGITSQAAQVRMTQGLKLERAGRATAMTYLQVVFAFVLGAMFFDETPTIWALSGAALIAVTTLGFSMLRSTADEGDVHRERA